MLGVCHPRVGGDPVFEVALSSKKKAIEEICGGGVKRASISPALCFQDSNALLSLARERMAEIYFPRLFGNHPHPPAAPSPSVREKGFED